MSSSVKYVDFRKRDPNDPFVALEIEARKIISSSRDLYTAIERFEELLEDEDPEIWEALCRKFKKDPVREYLKSIIDSGKSKFVTATPGTVDYYFNICLEHSNLLNSWERKFITSISRYSKLTSKQSSKLLQIANKVRIEAMKGKNDEPD